jgi:hypothetical protein
MAFPRPDWWEEEEFRLEEERPMSEAEIIQQRTIRHAQELDWQQRLAIFNTLPVASADNPAVKLLDNGMLDARRSESLDTS